ncbi:hypothetical protein AYI70_g174 [Smittium culicis]|uniref:Uncharacterized protein n=1 Tax=Smittium culicis TaxID=133412 RepID=A0A1R1YHW4_9FUNG|nr:hypothetical protein AYI70_g174 [Smittium culicis]
MFMFNSVKKRAGSKRNVSEVIGLDSSDNEDDDRSGKRMRAEPSTQARSGSSKVGLLAHAEGAVSEYAEMNFILKSLHLVKRKFGGLLEAGDEFVPARGAVYADAVEAGTSSGAAAGASEIYARINRELGRLHYTRYSPS